MGDTKEIIVTYNKWVKDKSIQIREGRCSDGCMIIYTQLLRIPPSNKLLKSQSLGLCLNISERTEKNWSLWMIDNELKITYGLPGGHPIMEIGRKADTCTIVSVGSRVNIFDKLEKYYNTGFLTKKFFVSSSTPGIEINGVVGSKRYLSVGHIKFSYQPLEDPWKTPMESYPEGTPLVNFYNKPEVRESLKHPRYIYMFFFYTFNGETGDILGISAMYLLRNSQYLVVFPSGLEVNGDSTKWILSVGDSDGKCKLLVFDYSEPLDLIVSAAKILPQSIPFEFIEDFVPTEMEM